MKQLPDITTFEYRGFFRRLADLDWHVHLHTECENLPFFIPKIEACGVKLVIDHLGRPDPKAGISSDGFKAMLKSIEKGRTWVKMSAAYRLGDAAPDYARQLGINGREHIRNNFLLTRHIKDYLLLFLSLFEAGEVVYL
jgi:predicted TIM-barrel fold metal-dependent hydrolase